jgi:hypothetical protein
MTRKYAGSWKNKIVDKQLVYQWQGKGPAQESCGHQAYNGEQDHLLASIKSERVRPVSSRNRIARAGVA